MIYVLKSGSGSKIVIKKILEFVGEETKPPSLSPAHGPPSWDDYDQDQDMPVENGQSIPEYEFNQCVSW